MIQNKERNLGLEAELSSGMRRLRRELSYRRPILHPLDMQSLDLQPREGKGM
jgi:hypothetical protein